jgi:hypothetical protein
LKKQVMGFAEKKIELFQIVANADEETTGKLIEFANQIMHKSEKFSNEELAKFHASQKNYLENTENSFSLEDAHAYVRSLKK